MSASSSSSASSGSSGRVAVVSGATSGIGLETARGLAKEGLEVVLIGRDPRRGEEALSSIRETTGSSRLSFVAADLSSIEEARRAGEEVARRHPVLDIFVSNAGAFFARRETTPDGLERTFALNHVAAFVLTHALLPALKSASSARVVVVASAAHRGATLDFEDLQMERGWSGWRAYQRSKLANVLFARELSRRLAGTRVRANALHPGFVASRFGRSNGAIVDALFRAAQLLAISPETSARSVLRLALSPELEGVSGAWFDRDERREPSPAALDGTSARRLWEVTARLAGVPA